MKGEPLLSGAGTHVLRGRVVGEVLVVQRDRGSLDALQVPSSPNPMECGCWEDLQKPAAPTGARPGTGQQGLVSATCKGVC